MTIKTKPPSTQYDEGWERIFGSGFKPHPGGGVMRSGKSSEAVFHGEPTQGLFIGIDPAGGPDRSVIILDGRLLQEGETIAGVMNEMEKRGDK